MVGIAVLAMLLAPRFGVTPEILPAAYIDTWQALGIILPAGAILYAARTDRVALRADALLGALVVLFGIIGVLFGILRYMEAA